MFRDDNDNRIIVCMCGGEPIKAEIYAHYPCVLYKTFLHRSCDSDNDNDNDGEVDDGVFNVSLFAHKVHPISQIHINSKGIKCSRHSF